MTRESFNLWLVVIKLHLQNLEEVVAQFTGFFFFFFRVLDHSLTFNLGFMALFLFSPVSLFSVNGLAKLPY